MKIFEVSTDGSSQWVAAENFKEAFDFVDGNTPFTDSDTCEDQLVIEVVPENEWDEKMISDEDNAESLGKSFREALAEQTYFPCLLACDC